MVCCLKYVLLLAAVVPVIWSASDCPPGMIVSDTKPGKCYLWVTRNKTWDDAAEFCQEHANNLTSIHSVDEINQVMGLAYLTSLKTCSHNHFWIGGKLNPIGGQFTWQDGSEWTNIQNSYVNGSTNPQSTAACISFTMGDRPCNTASAADQPCTVWNKNNCSEANCFVCEYFISSNTLTTTTRQTRTTRLTTTTTTPSTSTSTSIVPTGSTSYATTTTTLPRIPLSSRNCTLCPDVKLLKAVHKALNIYSQNVSGIALDISSFLKQDSAFDGWKYAIFVAELGPGFAWAVNGLLTTPVVSILI
uniref:C-type lectin domain-containing protein n=1 Tax=Plectus sambesii TaxID=2011161 RepID=A0A914VS16_9BILA